jgi:hypothetical protein
MGHLAIIWNFDNTQNSIISNSVQSAQQISVGLQGGAAAAQEIL